MVPPPSSLRVALAVYRGNPHSGGQGVYTRYLARELVELGHRVTVFAGQPYPILDDGVGFEPVPSLDLYRDPDPFRIPKPSEFRSTIDLLEFGLMCTAGFPEPLTFSLRLRRMLAGRRSEFDLIHDNQCFGTGLQKMIAEGWPIVGTCHHPITVDRSLDMSHAENARKKLALRRWYGFLGMQIKVARSYERVLTVSSSSKRDIVEQMGMTSGQLNVVPVGADHERFRPNPEVRRVEGRIMTTASADVPMKGLVHLLEAVAKLRTERPQAHLVVVGKARPEGQAAQTIERLGLGDAVEFVSKISDERLVELYNEAQVAVVPSLYEGFSLPAVEAMSSGTPLVGTTGGAIPEVVGPDGGAGLLVPPADPGALAAAIEKILDDPGLGAKLAETGRKRVLERFTWRACAKGTAENYYAQLEAAR